MPNSPQSPNPSGSQSTRKSIKVSARVAARIGIVAILASTFIVALMPISVTGYIRSTRDDRLVFTYYFYWYDWASGMHFYGSGCPDHNRYHMYDQPTVSLNDSSWHYREFKDMIAAGIDVFLPVYWGGNPGSGQNDSWSKHGLGPMRQALDRLHAENYNRENKFGVTNPIPKIGMFFDTTLMMVEYHGPNEMPLADMTNATHCRTFYLAIKDFFSFFDESYFQQVPDANNPAGPTAYVVWMYGANWLNKTSQSCLDYCKAEFLQDFGHSLVFVGTSGWEEGCPAIEGLYRWGTALAGPESIANSHIKIASLGPGFDNGNATIGAVCQVGQDPLFAPRSPEFYASNWSRVMTWNPNWVVVETWNEMHEGTPICRTTEFGTTYIDLNAQFSQQFHAQPLPSPVEDFLATNAGLTFTAVAGVIIAVAHVRSRKFQMEGNNSKQRTFEV